MTIGPMDGGGSIKKRKKRSYLHSVDILFLLKLGYFINNNNFDKVNIFKII